MTGTVTELGHQAQKSLATQQRILDAVIAIINEEGYAAASSKRICQRSGMTWGAVQHHFGSKEDILDAVLVASHEKFRDLMQDLRLRKGSITERCTRFIDLMWQHYQQDVFLAAMEILMASRGKPAAAEKMEVNSNMQAKEHLTTLREVFPESPLSDSQILQSLVFVHNLLTGMIIDRLFESQSAREQKRRETDCLAKARQILIHDLLAV